MKSYEAILSYSNGSSRSLGEEGGGGGGSTKLCERIIYLKQKSYRKHEEINVHQFQYIHQLQTNSPKFYRKQLQKYVVNLRMSTHS